MTKARDTSRLVSSQTGIAVTLSGDPIILGVGNTELVRVTGGGFVGIGTTNPITKVTIDGVAGTPSFRLSDQGFGVFDIVPGAYIPNSGGTTEIRALNSNSLRINSYGLGVGNVNIRLATDNTDRIIILDDGRVGVGTTNPSTSPLVTIGSSQSQTQTVVYLDRNPTGGYWSGLVFAANGEDRNSIFADSDFSFRFRTKTGAGSTDRIMINSNGKVGVNTVTFASEDRSLNVVIDDSNTYAGLTDFQQTYHALRLKNVQDSGVATRCVGMEFQVGSNGDAAITATEINDGNMQLSFGLRSAGYRTDRYKYDVARFQMNSVFSEGPWICGDPNLIFTLADDATVTFGSVITGAAIIAVYNTQSGYGGLFGVNFGSTAGIIYNGGQVANSDTDGYICVYKSSSSHGWTLKNRLGLSRNFSVAIFATHMQN